MFFDSVTFLKWVPDNAYPGLTYIFIFILAILIQFTFSGHITKKDNLSVFDHVISYLRAKLLVFYLLLTLMFNAFILLVALQFFGRRDGLDYMSAIYSGIFTQSVSVSAALSLLTVFLLPYFIHFLYRRLAAPRISAWKRRFRVSQTGESRSDIRVEQGKFASRLFDNRQYYQPGVFFLGLDNQGVPVYLTDDAFTSKNFKILGATQTGKGVIQQVLIDQAIWKGYGSWFFDQKPDDFIYSVMVESCQHWGRDAPVVLDLTGVCAGDYAPFEHGSLRERLQRFNKVFGLTRKGSDADFYKGINRQIMTFLSDYWDGTLQHLDKLLNGQDNAVPENKRQWIFDSSVNIRSRLDEWKLLPHLFPPKGEGFCVADELKKGSVVYIRARMDDDLIREVATSLLVEWKECVIKKNHTTHIFAVLDEVKFIISETVASALATVLSKDANLSLAYQERDDIMNVPDQTVDGRALRNQVETNTLITISYKCSFETAEWVASNTGTIQKTVTRMEQVETDGFGTEKWTGNRMTGTEEEHLISTNAILSLQKRVGIFMDNEGLARYLFTSWIDVKHQATLPVRKVRPRPENPVRVQPAAEPLYPRENGATPEPAEQPAAPQVTPDFVSQFSEEMKGPPATSSAKKAAADDDNDNAVSRTARKGE